MKKIILTILISTLAFGGCAIKDKTTGLIDDTKESVNNVVDKTIETVDDIEETAEKFKDAKDSLAEITK
jgi:PBP1b-binding outer membrane lipoprotein LpoB